MWTVPSSFGIPPVILFFPGILFGLVLWLISQLFVGNVTSLQVAIIIAGSLTGFAAAGSIYESMMAGSPPPAVDMAQAATIPDCIRRCWG